MYSEISACPCLFLSPVLLARGSLLTTSLPPRRRFSAPHLNHPRGYFCGPAVASALLSTLFLIVTLAATTLLLSNAHIHAYTRAHACTRTFSFARWPPPSLFSSLSSSHLSRASRRTSKSSEGRQSQRLSDWIVSSIYTTFSSLRASVSFFLSLSCFRKRKPTRSIYVTISQNGAF